MEDISKEWANATRVVTAARAKDDELRAEEQLGPRAVEGL